VSYNTGIQDSPQPAAANPTALAQLNLLGGLPEEHSNLALGALQTTGAGTVTSNSGQRYPDYYAQSIHGNQTNFDGGFNGSAPSPNPPSGCQGPSPNPPTGSPLPQGSAPPQGTVNIGISGNLNVPIIGPVGLGGTGFGGIAYDGTRWAWYYGGGGGVGVGASGSLGIQIGGSNAKSVSDLSGPFGFVSLSGGDGVIVGGEGYTGRGSQGQSVTGGNVFIGGGVGTPVSGTAGGTYTWVNPLG
jgi:hypothetical protein